MKRSKRSNPLKTVPTTVIYRAVRIVDDRVSAQATTITSLANKMRGAMLAVRVFKITTTGDSVMEEQV